MAARVVLESTGDPAIDLNHLRREGGEELIELLLQQANLDEVGVWRLRVEKKLPEGSEIRPVVVVSAKPGCIFLRIRPGDADTAYYCSLFTPAGLRSDQVYDHLKEIEGQLDRNWREIPRRQSTMSTANSYQKWDDLFNRVANGLPEQESAGAPADNGPVHDEDEHHDHGDHEGEGEDRLSGHDFGDADGDPDDDDRRPISALAALRREGKTDLRGWTRDPDKIRLTLLAIHELNNGGTFSSQAHFVEALANKLAWQGVSRYEIGGVFTSFVRAGYIIGIKRGSLAAGYALSPEGREMIASMLHAGEKVTPREPQGPAIDPTLLMSGLSQLASEYNDASQRLLENRNKRTSLMAEVDRLDEEAHELSKLVENREIQQLLQRLLHLTGKS